MNFIDNVVKTVKKHSPEILTGLGVVGVITGTVLACKETKNVDPIIDEHKEILEQIHSDTDENYSEKEKRKDITRTYARTGIKLIKLYSPSIIVIGGSLGCMIQSNRILNRRNIGLISAYTGLSKMFDEYRQNIVQKFGEEADIEARYSVKARKKKKGETEQIYEASEKTSDDDHSVFFDASSTHWDKSPNVNLMTLHSVEVNMNRKLKTNKDHVIALNEILNALDLPNKPYGRVLGYKYRPGIDPLDENGIPQVFKIAMYNVENRTKLESVDDVIRDGERDEPVMLLDFPNLVTIV